jgi:O-antigen/teichoic acid export membrane protein
MRLRKTLGLDGAVAYTFLARLINILGSTGTVLLIVRFLNPTEQGYYYTLLSLVSL